MTLTETRPPDSNGATPARDPRNDPETAVIGALIEYPARLDECPQLRAEHFYRPPHATIYQAVQTAYAGRGLEATHIEVAHALLATGEGRSLLTAQPAILADLIACRPPGPIGYYTRLTIEAWQERRGAEAITRAAQIAQGPGGLTAARQRLEQDLAELDQHATTATTEATRLVPADTFLFDAPDTPPALWGDNDDVLWARGETLIVGGPTGVGKSTLAQNILFAGLGIGSRNVLGHRTYDPGRVLYLASDRPSQVQRSMLRQVTPADRNLLHDRLVIWKGPPPSQVITNPLVYVELAKRADATTIYIDSVKDQAVGLAKDEVGAALNLAFQEALARGLDILALHHIRKPEVGHSKEPTSTDEFFGSTWITAGAGSVVSLWGAAGDAIINFRHLKQPATAIPDCRLRIDHVAGRVNMWHTLDVLDLLTKSGMHGMTAQALAKMLFPKDAGKNSDNEVEKARRQLDRLVADGLAHKSVGGGGRGQHAAYFAAYTSSGQAVS